MLWSNVISGILYQTKNNCVSSQDSPSIYPIMGVPIQLVSWEEMDWN